MSATTITSTFTDLNPKIVGGAVEMFSDDALFNFTNQTGQAWSDFHLQVGLGPAGTQGLASFAVGSSGDYKGPGNSSVSRTDVPSPFFDTMDIIGLSIPNGGVYSFSVDIVAGESGWIMAAYPTVGGVLIGRIRRQLLALPKGLPGLLTFWEFTILLIFYPRVWKKNAATMHTGNPVHGRPPG